MFFTNRNDNQCISKETTAFLLIGGTLFIMGTRYYRDSPEDGTNYMLVGAGICIAYIIVNIISKYRTPFRNTRSNPITNENIPFARTQNTTTQASSSSSYSTFASSSSSTTESNASSNSSLSSFQLELANKLANMVRFSSGISSNNNSYSTSSVSLTICSATDSKEPREEICSRGQKNILDAVKQLSVTDEAIRRAVEKQKNTPDAKNERGLEELMGQRNSLASIFTSALPAINTSSASSSSSSEHAIISID